MAQPETDSDVDRLDPLVFALGSAAFAVGKAMTMLTNDEPDPAVARMLAVFAVGTFINAGGLDLTQDQADMITEMMADLAEEGGLVGFRQ